MNITNDLLVGGIIFLIIILFRSVISNHRGGFLAGLLIIFAGYLLTKIDILYGELIILSGLILIIVGIIERTENRDQE